MCLVRAHWVHFTDLQCHHGNLRAFQDMIIWFSYKLKIFLWMTVQSYICAPLNGSTICTFNKSQAHAIKRFSTYVLAVIFNWIISHVTLMIYLQLMSFVNYHKFHINVMQSFIIVLRTLIRNSKNTLIKIPLLYNFPLCWLLNVNFKKKMNLETIVLM